MYLKEDIILAVDYHDENLVIRQFNCHTCRSRKFRRAYYTMTYES